MEGILALLDKYLQGTSVLAYPLAFLGGVLVSFTPCVYPLIPITIGYIGAKSAGSKRRGFVLSLSYVFGMSLTYSALGLIAATTSGIFGEIGNHPLAYFFLGNVSLFLGLSMFDVFNLPLPKFSPRINHPTASIYAALLLGLVSGLAVGPCIAPILGVILTYVATKHNLFFGASLLFFFAFGMGTLLIVVGTFSALLASLPRSGAWMVRVKRACGLILIFAGEYFFIQAGRLWL